ncbi:Rid family detoxifying hydrolase [Synergistaceae bacterium OttesenSCG-928-I11]|nr:Rid family detoxifying hydrolase [Synergistaceae bacterium OttesenSCG-928-I11]
MKRKTVNCDCAPPAVGAYSQGVWAGNILFLTGVCGDDPKTGELVGNGDMAAETKQAMENARAMLASEGLSFENVVNARIYITDFDDFGKMNDVYKSYFEEPYPARATVEVTRLAGGAKVEIVLTAYKE